MQNIINRPEEQRRHCLPNNNTHVYIKMGAATHLHTRLGTMLVAEDKVQSGFALRFKHICTYPPPSRWTRGSYHHSICGRRSMPCCYLRILSPCRWPSRLSSRQRPVSVHPAPRFSSEAKQDRKNACVLDSVKLNLVIRYPGTPTCHLWHEKDAL